MPFYVEFPADPVVNVHWRKKKPDDPNDPGEPTDFRQTCGAFQTGVLHGIGGLEPIWILDVLFLYQRIADTNPGHLPTKPYAYFPVFAEYEWFMPTHKMPYVWSTPSSWTLTFQDPISTQPLILREYRNINIQAFTGGNAAPDQTAEGSMTIEAQRGDEIYPPLFTTQGSFQTAHVLVQAHCCPKPGASGCNKFETTGSWWGGTDNDAGTPAACLAMLAPQPVGWGTFFDPNSLIQYPAPGSTADPVKPPPGARRLPEPKRPIPPLVFPERLEV